jgi:hypothetical protein
MTEMNRNRSLPSVYLFMKVTFWGWVQKVLLPDPQLRFIYPEISPVHRLVIAASGVSSFFRQPERRRGRTCLGYSLIVNQNQDHENH